MKSKDLGTWSHPLALVSFPAVYCDLIRFHFFCTAETVFHLYTAQKLKT